MEVRLLKTNKGTVSGYFNNPESLYREVAWYDGKFNVFFTMNPINQDIAARSVYHFTQFAKNTTTDREIDSRKWILIDLDPERPTGVSSTDKEFEKAKMKADEVEVYLKERGFPQPVKAVSGNGCHFLLPVNLPNNAESTVLVKDFLSVLDSMFSDDFVKVDVSRIRSHCKKVHKSIIRQIVILCLISLM